KTIALQPGSPAIDDAVLANCPPTDQRGVTRPQGAGCDIGAFELELVFNFTGFFQPVDNPPVYNRVKAGSGIPVKFSLGGDQGLDIFATDFPNRRAGRARSRLGRDRARSAAVRARSRPARPPAAAGPRLPAARPRPRACSAS